MRERRFREDLYYRLHVVTLQLPPLRDPPGPAAARAVLPPAARAATRQADRGLHARGAGRDARLPWPGNVRELAHAIERATILATGGQITVQDLALPAEDVGMPGGLPESTTLAERERHWVLTTLERYGGNQSLAATALGIDRSTLHRKLRQYGVAG